MDLLETSRILLRSGFLPPHLDSEAKVFAVITMGREIGIGMWQAINGINVIKGKPTISPQLMLALIYRSGQLEDLQVVSDDNRASVTMKRRGMFPHTEIFTLDDAIRLGVAGRNDNYKKQPAVMLKWRAVSAACRVVFPDVIMGFYTPEEMGADVVVDADGDMRLMPPTSSEAQPPDEGDARQIVLAQRAMLYRGAGDPAPVWRLRCQTEQGNLITVIMKSRKDLKRPEWIEFADSWDTQLKPPAAGSADVSEVTIFDDTPLVIWAEREPGQKDWTFLFPAGLEDEGLPDWIKQHMNGDS
jgi:hypothetical protein